MNIAQRRDFLIRILMFKCLHGLAPNYLSDPLVYTHDIHSHNTRQAAQNCLFVPSGRTNLFPTFLPSTRPKIVEYINSLYQRSPNS